MSLFLSFCFLVCNQINFGMWRDKDSALLTFQKEVLQEKKAFLDTLYLDMKQGNIKEQLDNHETKRYKYVAERYKTYNFNKDIASQPIIIASWNFSKQSLENQ